MPWLLDIPIDSGDLDDGSYGEVKITRFTQDANRKHINLRLEYGNTVDGKWNGGYMPRSKSSHATINDSSNSDYSDLIVASVPNIQTLDPDDSVRYVASGNVWVERTYYAVKRGIYEWLLTKGIIDAGSMI